MINIADALQRMHQAEQIGQVKIVINIIYIDFILYRN